MATIAPTLIGTKAPLAFGLRKLASPIILLGLCMAILGLAGTTLAAWELPDWVILALPVLCILACAVTIYGFLKVQSDYILVPIVLFVGQVLIVSGFGPAVHVFGEDQTQLYLAARPIATDTLGLARALSMSYVSIGVVLMSAGVFLYRARRRPVQSSGSFSVPVSAAFAFLGIGAALRFLLVTPSRWGLIDVTLPGVLVDAAMFFDVGIGLLCFIAYTSRPGLKGLFWLLLIGNMSLSLLDFSKLLVMLPAIISILFYFIAKRNMKVLIASVLAAGIIYSQIGPMTTFARTEIIRMKGDRQSAVSFSERVQIVQIYLADTERADARTVASSNPQAWWTRVNYTQQQAFAMREYEAGRPGDSLAGAWMLFIPRAIWQNKPIIYPPGKEFFRAATGRDFSFMAATIYGDIYWQFGWFGVFFISPLVGLFYGWLSWLTHHRIVQREFVYIPVVLLGMLAALQGAQQFLLNGILATVPVVIVVQLICSRLASMNQSKAQS